MSMILAIDPGPVESGFVLYADGRVIRSGICVNAQMFTVLGSLHPHEATLAIEKIEAMGMAVGAEVFETVHWSGRFLQAWREPDKVLRITRRAVKLHLCGSMRARDPHIRQALIDLLGPPGVKAKPGATYGVKSHCWSALAVAVTADAMASPDAIAPGLFAPPKAAKAPDAEFFA